MAFLFVTTSFIAVMSFSWIGVVYALCGFIFSLISFQKVIEKQRMVHQVLIAISFVIVCASFLSPGIFKVIWG